MAEIAPNLSYHYWLLGIIGKELEDEAKPLVLIRGSEFTPDKEIEMEDDEGHMGTATTRISSYRSNASASPSFTDKCRYKEGWEDIWYLLLGSADPTSKEIRKVAKTDEATVFDYTFAVNSLQPENPAFATIYNGFAKTEHDAFKYENCLLNEFELSGSNEEAPTYTATFASNFPKFNQQNPTRVIPKKTIFPKTADVRIYIAPQGDYSSVEEISQYEYPCYIDWSLSVNNNIENQPCSGDDFGTSTKVLGNREAEVSITVPWTEKTKHLEYDFMGGNKDATEVTTDNDVRTVWIVMENTKIQKNTGTSDNPTYVDTTYNYKTIIKIPEIVMTAVDSEQSGTDAKQIELEGNIQENGVDSFIEAVITTDLTDLHIDNGTTSP